jgi:hypothetical protein
MLDPKMDNKYMKKYSTSLARRKMQIKMTLSFHFILVRLAIIGKTTKNTGQDAGKLEPFYTVGRNVK